MFSEISPICLTETQPSLSPMWTLESVHFIAPQQLLFLLPHRLLPYGYIHLYILKWTLQQISRAFSVYRSHLSSILPLKILLPWSPWALFSLLHAARQLGSSWVLSPYKQKAQMSVVPTLFVSFSQRSQSCIACCQCLKQAFYTLYYFLFVWGRWACPIPDTLVMKVKILSHMLFKYRILIFSIQPFDYLILCK